MDILNIPFFYNSVRALLAGNQNGTKDLIQSTIKKYNCKRVVDFCCGTGDFAICTDGLEYLGLDVVDSYIRYSKNRYKSNPLKTFQKKDLLAPFKLSKKYDCGLLISTLHHFSDEDLNSLLQQVKKNINGIIIIADLDSNPPGLLRKILVQLDRGRYVRTNKRKEAIVKKYFKIIKTQTIVSRLAVQYVMICQN